MGVVRTYFDFLMNYAPYFYYLPDSGIVDPEWGRGPAPASFAVQFLNGAYNAKEFENEKAAIQSKIVALADYLLSIQCVDDSKLAYGGFKSRDDSVYYYSIDAMRAIHALLIAYDLTSSQNYLDAAKLAGGTFLYNMQHKPSILGVHDQYYGGFAQAVTLSEAWLVDMYVADLYGTMVLKELHTRTGETKYETMKNDALGFYRGGFENLFLKYSPPPYGDGNWHRTGAQDNLVYDDDFGYALHGLFCFEGWSQTVKKVYESINTIERCVEFPSYNPRVCWAGYVDVVNRKPACDYYDCVTAGILFEIRNSYDSLALDYSAKAVLVNPDNFMFWGIRFADYAPVENKKSIVTVAWLVYMMLNYSPLTSVFTRILQVYGRRVILLSRHETNGATSYSEAATITAIVNPAQASETLIQPGYASNDVVHVYTVSSIAHRDKISFDGKEYEVGPVEEFRFQNQLMYRTAVCRRLIQ